MKLAHPRKCCDLYFAVGSLYLQHRCEWHDECEDDDE